MSGCAVILKVTEQLHQGVWSTALAARLFSSERMKSCPTYPDRRPTMTKRGAIEYQAKVTNDAGILRGKIPSPLVRDLGARAGDYITFSRDNAGRVIVGMARARGAGKGGAKKAAKKSAKRR
jgi:hypothetical protein